MDTTTEEGGARLAALTSQERPIHQTSLPLPLLEHVPAEENNPFAPDPLLPSSALGTPPVPDFPFGDPSLLVLPTVPAANADDVAAAAAEVLAREAARESGDVVEPEGISAADYAALEEIDVEALGAVVEATSGEGPDGAQAEGAEGADVADLVPPVDSVEDSSAPVDPAGDIEMADETKPDAVADTPAVDADAPAPEPTPAPDAADALADIKPDLEALDLDGVDLGELESAAAAPAGQMYPVSPSPEAEANGSPSFPPPPPPPQASSSLDHVDVDLGPLKSVSRNHAKIEYRVELGQFCLEIFGRNGAWVDDRYYVKGTIVPLHQG